MLLCLGKLCGGPQKLKFVDMMNFANDAARLKTGKHAFLPAAKPSRFIRANFVTENFMDVLNFLLLLTITIIISQISATATVFLLLSLFVMNDEVRFGI